MPSCGKHKWEGTYTCICGRGPRMLAFNKNEKTKEEDKKDELLVCSTCKKNWATNLKISQCYCFLSS